MTRIFFVLLSLLGIFANTGCELPTDGAPDAAAYNRCADPDERTRAKEAYQFEMFQDYLGAPISEQGLVWTLDNLSRYEKAGIFARCRNTDAELPVLINYYGGIGARDRFFKYGDTEEKEIVLEEIFRRLMEELMEEYFPGYNFALTFNRDPDSWISSEEAIFIIHVAYDEDRYSYADLEKNEVYLIHPTIIGHEAGHLCPTPEDENGFCMGFPHHYKGDDTSDHSEGPPEEDEGGCVMYRNANTFGRTESMAALLTYEPGAEERIESLSNQIRAMLPDEMNARSGTNKCGTVMSDVLIDH